jgi:hypothetical protein
MDCDYDRMRRRRVPMGEPQHRSVPRDESAILDRGRARISRLSSGTFGAQTLCSVEDGECQAKDRERQGSDLYLTGPCLVPSTVARGS